MPLEVSGIKLDQLVYVELEANNGGMMLTVSETGFSFRAVTAVLATDKTPFSFTINGTQKLSGLGRIEWTKDQGKVAGLLFTEVTSEFREELRSWLEKLGSVSGVATQEANASEMSPNLSAGGPSDTATEPLRRARPIELKTDSWSAASTANESSLSPDPEHQDVHKPLRPVPSLTEWKYPEDLTETKSPPFSRVAIAAAVVALLALTLFLYAFRAGIGQSLIAVGERMSNQNESAKATGAVDPEGDAGNKLNAPPDPTKSNVTGPAAPKSLTEPAATERESQINSRSTAESRSTDTPAKPDQAFEDARPDSSTSPEYALNASPEAAGQSHGLWAEVAKGNTSAEVTLAKLYLIGSGVPKSCAQARVLLQAAAKKGNVEAIDKLAQIRRQGCP